MGKGMGVFVTVVTLGAPADGAGQTASLEARRDGLALLASGMEAMGGLERLRSLRTVRQRAEVLQYQVGQAASADSVAGRRGTSYYTFVRDLGTGGWFVESSAERDAPEPRLRIVSTPADRFQHDLAGNRVLEFREDVNLDVLSDRLPFAPEVLLQALQRAETVRRLPGGAEGSNHFAALAFADSTGRQITLTFDGGNLLRSVETVEAHEQLGDVVRATTFDDYRRVGDLLLPFSSRSLLGDVPYTETTTWKVELDPGVDVGLFQRPEDVPVTPPRPRPTVSGGEQKVEEIVPGVFQVLNVTPLYNVLFVQQGDRVFVIEAPGDEGAYDFVQESIASTCPGARVEALVLTHHHYDHTSSLWRYLRDGARVFAPGGAAGFVRDVARAPRLASGSMPPDVDVEPVYGRRLIGSGPNRFELIDVGPNPHSVEILVAYFPEHGLMWVADIYGYFPGFTPPQLLVPFADELEELGLDVTTFATAHTDLSDIGEFREMVGQARSGG